PAGTSAAAPFEGADLASAAVAQSNGGVIQLKVSPKLPQIALDTAAAARAPKGEHYVLLQAREPGRVPPGLPFRPAGESGVVGVIVPGESSQATRSFFRTGGAYAYDINGAPVPFTVLGAFSNRADAEALDAAASGTWYTLSPYE